MVPDKTPATSHLAYYREHGISPVRYDISDLDAHFDRRDSLYRGLGLPPIAFKGCNVLEVAPGSGENSLYVASTMPALYELVEPNPTAIERLKSLYEGFTRPHTTPALHTLRLEEFSPGRRYDVVLCENWLSALPHERLLIRKLAGLVAPGGVLAMTITPLSGFVPNVIRKLMALRLVDRDMPFDEKASALTEIFGAHLRTIQNMTRSHRDWVLDCMLNPHYLHIVLPIDAILEEIGSSVEILASVPRFSSDWRWFKSLFGDQRQFNTVFRENYVRNLHNFMDYRFEYPARSAAENAALEVSCRELHDAAVSWQAVYDTTGGSDSGLAETIRQRIERIGRELRGIDPRFEAAFDEAARVWGEAKIEPQRVMDMEHFAGLFGRETIYISAVAKHQR